MTILKHLPPILGILACLLLPTSANATTRHVHKHHCKHHCTRRVSAHRHPKRRHTHKHPTAVPRAPATSSAPSQTIPPPPPQGGPLPSPWPFYDNIGPNAIADCDAAAAADWIIATQGITPPEAEVISDFYAAGGSAIEGIRPLQFGAWWTVHPIDGYSEFLTVAYGGTARATMEAQAAPTLASVTLPSGVGHLLLVLHASAAGVTVVTWGRETVESWTEWEATANAVYTVATSTENQIPTTG